MTPEIQGKPTSIFEQLQLLNRRQICFMPRRLDQYQHLFTASRENQLAGPWWGGVGAPSKGRGLVGNF